MLKTIRKKSRQLKKPMATRELSKLKIIHHQEQRRLLTNINVAVAIAVSS